MQTSISTYALLLYIIYKFNKYPQTFPRSPDWLTAHVTRHQGKPSVTLNNSKEPPGNGGSSLCSGGDCDCDGVMVFRKTPHLLCGLLAVVLTGKSPWWTQITDYTFLAVKSLLLVKTNITKLSLSLTDEGSLSSSIQPSASNRSKTKANILMYNRGELSTIFPY